MKVNTDFLKKVLKINQASNMEQTKVQNQVKVEDIFTVCIVSILFN